MNHSDNPNTNMNVNTNANANPNPNPNPSPSPNPNVVANTSNNVSNTGQASPVGGYGANTNIQVQTTGQVQPQVLKQAPTVQNVSSGASPVGEKTGTDRSVVPPTNEKKPGNFRYFLLIVFFISLLALVWFLPDLRKYMLERKMAAQEEVIHGTLKCVYEEEDEDITTLYTSEFKVENNKVKGYISTVETKGTDNSAEELEKLNTECELLKDMTSKVAGVQTTCSLNSRKQINKQELDYRNLDKNGLSSAYSEAGGVMPEYNLDQDAREIKKEMQLARYSCVVN